MNREILLLRDALETRAAVFENGGLVEFQADRPQDSALTGNIYKGRVVRVLPHLQSAFVDIGEDRTAYLFADDALPADAPKQAAPNIADLVRQGQEILVQVEKEPALHKGAKLTAQIALPGRFVVLFPGKSLAGVSHRVADEAGRARLRELLQELAPQGFGLVARTAAGAASREEIAADIAELVSVWEQVQKKAKTAPVPSLVHGELDLPLRVVRDFLPDGFSRVVCDSEPLFDSVKAFVAAARPDLAGTVELQKSPDPAGDVFGLDDQLRKALARRVWLKSGGYLVIDTGEAMTAIDVNTGKNTGKNNFEDTVRRTNLEAAAEIARQLRLRNTGGIVVIDFIDMKEAQSREQVSAAFSGALAKDRARCTITRISELGLVEMTRKRHRDSLTAQLEDLCPCCEGSGRVLSAATTARDLLREVRREARRLGPAILVRAHPSVVDRLTGPDLSGVEELEQRMSVRLRFRAVEGQHPEKFDLETAKDTAASGRRVKQS